MSAHDEAKALEYRRPSTAICQLDRIEAMLTEIRDALVAQPPENMPKSMPPSAPYDPLAPRPPGSPLGSTPLSEAMLSYDAQLATALPLPPARPAGSEPDLDTALTMGMEAPAPLVPPERKGPPSLYPQSSLTPGVTFPNITGDDVSVPGYAKRVRAVPDAMKRAVYLRYGLDPSKHDTAEVDHYVSLCLGGTNDIENLWPEPAVTPDAPGQVGFHEKDAVEFWLHQQVCNKSMTLQAAQDAIRGDWYAVWLTMPRDHVAMMSAMLDAPEQP
jgi:hypothetical protein